MIWAYICLVFALAIATRLLLLRSRPDKSTRDATLARLRAQRIQPSQERIRQKGKGLDRQIPITPLVVTLLAGVVLGIALAMAALLRHS